MSPRVRAGLLSLFGVLLASAQCAAALESGSTAPIVDCRSAAAAFEQSAGLPPGLLLAIGLVESGRWDPVAGRTDPWPWATNHAGEGHYFGSAQEAIAWVAAQQAAGIQSIDVGCFQVNLLYHPDAFATLAEAFEPTANARYAAAFLNRLHEQTGNWTSAVARYHSADPFEGQQYGSRVMAAWNTGLSIAASPSFVAGARSASPVVVRLSTMASAVRVVVPDWAGVRSFTSVPAHVTGLPRVIAPSR
jgi:hypothetical protein